MSENCFSHLTAFVFLFFCRSFCTALFACWSCRLLFCIRCFPRVLIPCSESVLCKNGTIKNTLETLGSGCLGVGVGKTGGLLASLGWLPGCSFGDALMSVSSVFPMEASFPWEVSSSPSETKVWSPVTEASCRSLCRRSHGIASALLTVFLLLLCPVPLVETPSLSPSPMSSLPPSFYWSRRKGSWVVACCLEWGRKPGEHLELTLTCSLIFSLRFTPVSEMPEPVVWRGFCFGRGFFPCRFQHQFPKFTDIL